MEAVHREVFRRHDREDFCKVEDGKDIPVLRREADYVESAYDGIDYPLAEDEGTDAGAVDEIHVGEVDNYFIVSEADKRFEADFK